MPNLSAAMSSFPPRRPQASGSAAGLPSSLRRRRNQHRPPSGRVAADTRWAVEVTAIYDGIWERPHVRPSSERVRRGHQGGAGQRPGSRPNRDYPVDVAVLRIGDRLVMLDSGSAAMQPDRRQASGKP